MFVYVPAQTLAKRYTMEHGQTAKMLPPQSMTFQSQLSQVFLQRHTQERKISIGQQKVKYNGKTLKSDTDYTVSYSSNKNVGTATVKITGKGQYSGTVSKTFKINPAKQKIQKLTAKSKAFFIDWAQKGSATGYEVQYATNSKFTGAKKLDVANNKTDKMTISKLSANKKYYVKVRSYTLVKGTKYYGEWSAVKSVTVKK